MNTRKWLVSSLMFVCILLSACAPAITPSSPPAVVPHTVTAMPGAPTAIASDPRSLAELAGGYVYKGSSHIWFRADGTYATLAGFGTFVVAPDQITFVDTLPASGTQCGPDPGVYTWILENNFLTFAPIKDGCKQRATVLGGNTFKKIKDDPGTPVEFIWRITGAPNTFVRNTQIAVDGQSNIYVVDGGNHRIQKYDANGEFLTMWGSRGDGEGQFVFQVLPDHFGAVAVDGAGNVYVTDYNSRVQKFDSNGKFLLKWGSPGSGDGQLASHSHMQIAVDSMGNVYVSDNDNFRVQKFDSNGQFLLKWGSKGNGDAEFGSGPDESGPEGIAVDSQGNVYVADPANYRIEKFDAHGNFLSQWGSQGTGGGQFLEAGEVAVDRQGNVYVTDNQQNVGGPSNQVSKFDGNGKFLLKWGSTGMDLGMFNYIGGIAIDNQGNFYITSEDMVQKFRPK